MMPKVVHCKREPFDAYIGRPTIYGNPFSHKDGTKAAYKVATVEEAVQKYEEWLMERPHLIAIVKRELRGKVLGCWCKVKGDEPCHGDVLLKIANE